MKSDTKQSGFSVGVVVLVIAALAACGGVVWYVLDQNKKQDTANTTQEPTINEPMIEDETQTQEDEKLVTASFEGIGEKKGSGSVSIIKNADNTMTLKLEDDFSVQDGPDLYVAFGNNGEVDKQTLFAELKKISGEQEYEVPEAIDVTKYNQVIIYCKEFATPFAAADIGELASR